MCDTGWRGIAAQWEKTAKDWQELCELQQRHIEFWKISAETWMALAQSYQQSKENDHKTKTVLGKGRLIAPGLRSYPIRFSYGHGVKEDENKETNS